MHVKKEGGFKYVEEGQGETILLLHGLFGALSNFEDVVHAFAPTHRVIIPVLPIYEMPVKEATLEGLLKFVEEFVAYKQLKDVTLLGNSLGGHIALIYALANQQHVKRLVLTGSSGLFEHSMGASYPRRGSYDFVKERVEYTFFDPVVAKKELIDEVFDITKDIPTCLRMVSIARSAQRHNLANDLHKIKIPVLLIWGLNDTITPPIVAHEFNKLLSGSELWFIDRCGHASMMEHPGKFNKLLAKFIQVEQLV